MILLTVQVRGYSIWGALSYIPGFDVIRVIGRIQLISHFLICISLALILIKVNISKKSSYYLVVGLVALIYLENINLGLNAQVNLRRQKNLINLGDKVPNECDSFFATSNDFERPNFAHQVDSMIVSIGAKIPTLNGYSGNQPFNWEVNNIQYPDYADRIKNWIKFKNINETICQIDLDNKKWSVFRY